MLRIHVSLTAKERRALDAESERTGRSVSALIRDAVDMVHGTGRSTEQGLTAMRTGFGAWKDRDAAGAVWADLMRSGSRLQQTP